VHQIPYSQSTTCASNPIFKEHYLSIKSHIQTALFVHQIPCSKSIVCASNPIFKEHYLCIKSHIHRALRVHQILYSKCIKSHIQTALFVHQIPYSQSTTCASNPIFKEHYLCIKSHIQRALFVHQIPYLKSTFCASSTRVLWVCVRQILESSLSYSTHLVLESGNLYKAHQVYIFPSIAKKILFLGLTLWVRVHLLLESPLLYGVATISRLLKITGLFCKRAL